MLGIYRVAAQLVASRVVLSSTELVTISENNFIFFYSVSEYNVALCGSDSDYSLTN
jgi:hypothetical protein